MGDLVVRSTGALVPTAGMKAIDVRRGMVTVPEVRAALTGVEMSILEASTKRQISDFADAELVQNVKQMLRYIAMDIGFTPKDTADWAYQQTRIVDVMKRYFGNMTLAEIRLAFELAVMGELDDYLPKDAAGNADRKHYQQFNVEYFSKIVKAYRAKHEKVVTKAYKALPERRASLTEEQEARYRREIMESVRYRFLEYKYTGHATFSVIEEMLVYEFLLKLRLADEVTATSEDRNRAYAVYMQRFAQGLVNQFEARAVKRKGVESKEIDYGTYEIARRREITRTFDRMIAEEIQIENYI